MPTTVRPLLSAFVASAICLLAACGDDDSSTTAGTNPGVSTSSSTSGATATTTAGTTSTASTTVAPASNSATTSALSTPDAPTTTPSAAASVASTAQDAPRVVSVTVGVDSGPDRVEYVELGSTVSLEITNPAADDEFHLHDYDLGGGTSVPAGETARFTFTADRAGSFELESHVTEDVYLVLEVG